MISLEPVPPDSTPVATKPKRKLPAGLLAYQARKRAEKERAKAPKTSRVPSKTPKARKAKKRSGTSTQRTAATTSPANQNAPARRPQTSNARFYL